MAEFTLEQIEQATQCAVLKRKDTQFSGVTTDTRRIEAGSLFIALRGERFDGHSFVRQAVDRGAAGVFVSQAYPPEILDQIDATTIFTEDTLRAYQRLARAHRKRFTMPVIAITGSNGKTTTKDLTAAALGTKLCVLKTQANYNNEIGLPLTLLQLEATHQAAVVEMGMRGSGQIQALAEIALPTIGVVTNVGETHIELLGSVEHIARAKRELVEAISAEGTVILNADDPYVAAMRGRARGKVLTFGCDMECDVRASAVRAAAFETHFICRFGGREADFTLPIVGKHNVYNALAAIAVGTELGLTLEEMRAGIGNFSASGMRLALMALGGYMVLNDAYNASPMSMTAAIDTLAEVAQARRIAVLGDMLELGDFAVEAHERIGALLAQKQIDAVVTVGDMARHISSTAAAHGVKQTVHCTDHAEAGKTLGALLEHGDTILIKGSRGMQMEKVIALL